MKKRLITTLLTAGIFSLCMGSLAFASTDLAETANKQDVVLYSKAEIKDMNQLYNLAKAGVQETQTLPTAAATLSDENTSAELTPYTTNQVLKEVKKSDGSIEKKISETTFYDVQASDLTRGTGNTSEENWDSTLAVRAYSTIYYTTSYQNLETYLLLTKVTGGWTISDTSTSISNRSVHYMCSNAHDITDEAVKYPSSNTYSYNTGFSQPIQIAGSFYKLGMESMVKLTRGGSQWNLQLNNWY